MKKLLPFLLVVSVVLSGCFFNEPVGPNQVAAVVVGGEFKSCEGLGIKTNLDTFADLVQISGDTLKFDIADPQVATKDSQLVGVAVAVQVRRKTDCESVKGMLTNWSKIVENDDNLKSLIEPVTLEGIKSGTRSFTLDSLLDDRNGLASSIQKALETDAAKFYVDVVSVQVANVEISADYAALLQEKAALTAKKDKALKEQDLIRQEWANKQLEQQQAAETYKAQLEAEKAKTQVDVEVAKRQGEVTAAQNAVYAQNPQAYELARLDKLAKVYGDRTVYFIPQDSALNLWAPISGTVGVR